MGIFSKDSEMVEEFQKKIEIIDQRLHDFSKNDLEENELIEEQETSLSDSLVSDIGISTAEELIFPGALQPLLAKILAVSLPALGKKAFMTIALPNLVSTLAIGILFGAYHYQDYTKGEIIAATNIAIAGCLFGITKERYGLISAIIAHSKSNMLGTFVEYYRPSYLPPLLEKTEEIETK